MNHHFASGGKSSSLLLAAALMAGFASHSIAQSPAPATDSKIGLIAPTGGRNAQAGKAYAAGAAMAFTGTKYSVVAVSDDGEPGRAADQAERLISQGVAGIVGGRSPGPAKTLSTIAAEAKIPLVGLRGLPASARAAVPPNVKVCGVAPEAELTTLLNAMAPGSKLVAMLVEDDSPGALLLQVGNGIVTKSNAKLLPFKVARNSVSSLAEVTEGILKAKPDVVILAVGCEAAATFLRESAKVQAQQKVGLLSRCGPEEAAKLAGVMQGFSVALALPGQGTETYRQFTTALQKTDAAKTVAMYEGWLDAIALIGSLSSATPPPPDVTQLSIQQFNNGTLLP